MRENEIKLIKEIGEKNNIDAEMLIDLIKTEKEFVNLNMSRRHGIYKQLNSILDSYLND